MPFNEFLQALSAWAGNGGEAQIRALAAPAILAAILIIHSAYFIFNRSLCGQQEIALEDLTDLGGVGCTGPDGLTVVQGDRQEFDASTRTVGTANFALPACGIPSNQRGPQRLREPQIFEDCEVRHSLICGDDLLLRGRTLFYQPLKVSGDLTVEGEAVFLAPVIIAGVLKVSGSAHFAAGVIAKGDAMVRGSMAIGSDTEQGWGVVRELALEQRLTLNGTLVASRAVRLKKAA